MVKRRVCTLRSNQQNESAHQIIPVEAFNSPQQVEAAISKMSVNLLAQLEANSQAL